MILQTAKEFTNPKIEPYGCHVLAECYIINRVGNITMTVEKIEDMIAAMAKVTAPNGEPAIDPDDMTVNDPDAIVRYFGLKEKETARFESPLYICRSWEQELLQWKRPGWVHWVAGDGRGNVSYDPEGYSVTVAQGAMSIKKVFSIIRSS